MAVVASEDTLKMSEAAKRNTRPIIVLIIHFSDGSTHELKPQDETLIASFEETIPYLFRKFYQWLRPGWRGIFMSEEQKRYYQDNQLYKQTIIDRTQITHIVTERIHIRCD